MKLRLCTIRKCAIGGTHLKKMKLQALNALLFWIHSVTDKSCWNWHPKGNEITRMHNNKKCAVGRTHLKKRKLRTLNFLPFWIRSIREKSRWNWHRKEMKLWWCTPRKWAVDGTHLKEKEVTGLKCLAILNRLNKGEETMKLTSKINEITRMHNVSYRSVSVRYIPN